MEKFQSVRKNLNNWSISSSVFCSNPFLKTLTENKSKRELIRMLVQKGYESDPVAAWAKAQEKVCYTHTHTHSTNVTSKPKNVLELH